MLQSQIRFLICMLCFPIVLKAQETLYQHKKIPVTKDLIDIDSTSINPSYFALYDKNKIKIDSTLYRVDFVKATIKLDSTLKKTDTIHVHYLKYPIFLTKSYSFYDVNRLVSSTNSGNIYKTENRSVNVFKPFDGLETSGSITRGLSIGNNQNAAVNSNLDLQVIGKLSDKVSIRASLQDNNIPLQNGGYSQRLDEFDQVFVELFSDRWSVRGGDLFLENRKSRFLNFNKKVQGVLARVNLGTSPVSTEIMLSGAVVRGQYAKSNFTGQEGNQGPYKLRGPNDELYVLVISGSERVYVNGNLLERGENNQYVIDYNAGELTFTSLFPVNSEMRIVVEYQFSERSFNRFVTYGGTTHQEDKWHLDGFVYSENDAKNQPLQQSLSSDQIKILSEAGDNPALLNAPSAVIEPYTDKKILYKKTIIETAVVYVYSNDPKEELYQVKFSLVGKNKGNYIVKSTVANGRIYEYVPALAGIKQGEYDPIIRLIAPSKLQIATLLGGYKPSDKTTVDFELAVSNNDLNLYSDLDDENNKGAAGKFNIRQKILSKKYWGLTLLNDLQFIQKEYRPIERLFAIEFDRDWNLKEPIGNQLYISSGLLLDWSKSTKGKYQFENLNFSESFSGNRHLFSGIHQSTKWFIKQQGSLMNSESKEMKSQFFRNEFHLKYKFHKNWVGVNQRLEENQERVKSTFRLTNLSQRFTEWGTFIGRGDSTKVYAETGLSYRLNDSLQAATLKRVNRSISYYLNSKLIQNNQADLSVFVNYRQLLFEGNQKKESSLNSRVLYNQRLFNGFVQYGLSYETLSGSIPQQEFNFIEVEPTKGIYAWNDYNKNGIQELQEFEIAQFPDQAKYIKVFLPNQNFVKTHQNKFSQSVTLNPFLWVDKKGYRKIISYFYNQTSFLIDKKIKKEGERFDLNPFINSKDQLLGLTSSIRNSFFYNRGKQNHSVVYNFIINEVKSLLVADELTNTATSHQLSYTHLLKKYWLFTLNGSISQNNVYSVSYLSKNFQLRENQLEARVGYLFSKNTTVDLFYEFQKKRNETGALEKLFQNRLGISFNVVTSKEFVLNGEFAYINNSFEGNSFSPVSFQMLEGLQVNKNMTWRMLLQKKLTEYLDVNFNYQGRKSETSETIHTGNVQLRAFF
ncbi:hypothetical protein [Flavobacterium columnare]|uniref:DUF2460 domain-containing protein n=1 Tax=Flavobacterium columnare TaxID=996 RepID=A0AAI8CGP4_9FLAO|nr:hypothetical protein [Flavobacterium columnare]AMO20840.1 hypothetical protein UN65_11335 [Flavobacterium columnare]AUX18832.1 hypothetical protein AQ623_11545 [Flavobacterium columnare]QOG57916.1 hypothetical protein HUE29_11390 [Flavobacterium columnare]QOG60639.1 hypothetical protein HUE30_11390 [Flavobacterium columnare]QOG63358.1 hypothetical protein HUE31_11390 [Flavobacterium columnare]